MDLQIQNMRYYYQKKSGQTVHINPIKVGSYYYFWVGPQAPCVHPSIVNENI